jgi:4'-phosphopantetheinyl transferase EntD
VHEDEIQDIRYARKERILEFLNGRNCAHLALKKLGFQQHHAILRGNNREPIWPDTIVGSITHCQDYYAATVAYAEHISGIGIDAELNTKLSNKLLSTTQTKNELTFNQKLCSISDVCINKLVFSAKESVFKFIYPYLKQYIKFMDIEIYLDFKTSTFSALLINKISVEDIDMSSCIGKFKFNETHIVSCFYKPVVC